MSFYTVCFTDGSEKRDSTGAGIFGSSEGLNITVPLGTYVKVYKAEVTA